MRYCEQCGKARDDGGTYYNVESFCDCASSPCSGRRGFEEWFELHSLHEHSNWFRRDEDGDYAISFVDAQWESWQAAWQAAISWQNTPDLSSDEGGS